MKPARSPRNREGGGPETSWKEGEVAISGPVSQAYLAM